MFKLRYNYPLVFRHHFDEEEKLKTEARMALEAKDKSGKDTDFK